MTLKLFTLLLLAASCFGQTAPTNKQIGGSPFPTPQVLVIVPPGTGTRVISTWALIDVDTVTPFHVGTLILDTTTVPPTLRAKPSTGPVFVDGETPGGTLDGTNVTFTLANAPNPSTSLHLYRNGLRQKLGFDYTFSGSTIVFLTVATPQPGDTLLVDYRQ